MPQDMSYPDPEQLKSYALEPMPFHEINASSLELMVDDERFEDYTLRCGFGNTEYLFRATYIMVETTPGEWEHIEDVSYFDMTHEEAWQPADDLQIEEDFICTTGIASDTPDGPIQYDAYWLLAEVVIRNPDAHPTL